MSCAVASCKKDVQARGWCPMHYQRWRHHGDPLKGAKHRKGVCSIEGCDSDHYGQSYCQMHYYRWRTHGDAEHVERVMSDDLTRFMEYVDDTGDCWEWTGGLDRKGYGRVWHGGTCSRAPRVAYELFVGEIPVGLQIDHLCRNKVCVNPRHLEPVTLAENIRRRDLAKATI